MLLRVRQVPACNRHPRVEVMGHRDVFVHFVLRGSRMEPAHILASLVELTGTQPMLSQCRFEPNVIAPAKPRIALEDVSDFMKRRGSFLPVTGVGAIDTSID